MNDVSCFEYLLAFFFTFTKMEQSGDVFLFIYVASFTKTWPRPRGSDLDLPWPRPPGSDLDLGVSASFNITATWHTKLQ